MDGELSRPGCHGDSTATACATGLVSRESAVRNGHDCLTATRDCATVAGLGFIRPAEGLRVLHCDAGQGQRGVAVISEHHDAATVIEVSGRRVAVGDRCVFHRHGTAADHPQGAPCI